MADLGSQSTLLSPGTTTNISISPSVLSAVSGANPMKWALWGWNYDPNTGEATTMSASLTADPSTFTPAQVNGTATTFAWNSAANLYGQTTGDGLLNVLVPAADPNSFSQTFGNSGSMAGSFPVSVEGSFNSTLNVVEGNFGVGSAVNLGIVGLASLNGDGSLLTISGPTPSVVPIPASVVLFGSGLIGLVGIARRRLMTA
jgi:hypothetical protein